MEDCIFCKIANGAAKSHLIMEDSKHMAFLDIFPSMKGQTLVITKDHFDSYAFDMPDDRYLQLLSFAKTVGKLLDSSLGAKRTCMVIEGMQIGHIHLKLYPLIKIDSNVSPETGFSESYKGFLSTQLGPRADEGDLEKLASSIRESNKA